MDATQEMLRLEAEAKERANLLREEVVKASQETANSRLAALQQR